MLGVNILIGGNYEQLKYQIRFNKERWMGANISPKIQGFCFFWGLHFGIAVAIFLCGFFDLSKPHLGSALLAGIAILAIYHNALINKRRATIELILRTKTDEKLIASKRVLSDMTSDQVTALAKQAAMSAKDGESADDDSKPKIEAILQVINTYEFVAAGIRERAFDYKLFHRLQYSMVNNHWAKTRGFIIAVREETQQFTLFQEFEWIANDFKKNKLRKNFNNQ